MTPNKQADLPKKPTVAIIGAGPAGLMAADYLRQFDVTIHVFEQKPSPARKLLMAGNLDSISRTLSPLIPLSRAISPTTGLRRIFKVLMRRISVIL